MLGTRKAAEVGEHHLTMLPLPDWTFCPPPNTSSPPLCSLIVSPRPSTLHLPGQLCLILSSSRSRSPLVQAYTGLEFPVSRDLPSSSPIASSTHQHLQITPPWLLRNPWRQSRLVPSTATQPSLLTPHSPRRSTRPPATSPDAHTLDLDLPPTSRALRLRSAHIVPLNDGRSIGPEIGGHESQVWSPRPYECLPQD